MEMMEFRQNELASTLEGLQQTQIPLVAEYEGVYRAAGFTDDLGIYYFIPKLAQLCGISIDQASTIFFNSLWVIGALTAFVAFFFIFNHWTSRLIAMVGTLFFVNTVANYQDVYCAQFFVVTVVVPLIILGCQKKKSGKLLLISILALSGLIIGYGNFIRCYASTGVLLFAILWLLLNKNLEKKEKAICCAILLIFTMLPYWHFKHLENRRDNFLTKATLNYQPAPSGHPIWHIVYIGLGYLENQHGLEYSDTCAWNAARNVKADVFYCSDEYAQILKTQFFKIVKNDPWLLIRNIVTKFYVVCLKLLQFFNIGLLFYFYVKPKMGLVVPFVTAILFYAIPGLLSIPINNYLLGMVSIAVMFEVYMIGLGLEKFLKIYPVQADVLG